MDAVPTTRQINLISDVILNRPPPLREFDQIYMKAGDMWSQIAFIAPYFERKRVVFIGDGDAIGLGLIHLTKNGTISEGPTEVKILDFDERIVDSINSFARSHDLVDCISAELYNVADPLPEKYWQSFCSFYTNPPYGKHNKGKSVLAFVRRGMEAVVPQSGLGCIVIGDDKKHSWTHEVLYKTQEELIAGKFLIKSFNPEFSQYHLDDAPLLHSCSFFALGINQESKSYGSKMLPASEFENFYGRNQHLEVQYVKINQSDTERTSEYTFSKYDLNQLKIQFQ